MKPINTNKAFTLIEMIVVVAIIIILLAVTLAVSKKAELRANEKLAKSELAILEAALEEFADSRFSNYLANFDDAYRPTEIDERAFYESLRFPVDCNQYDLNRVEQLLGDVLDAGVAVAAGNYKPEYSSSAVLYFLLNQVPQCKAILQQLDSWAVTSKDEDGFEMKIEIDDGYTVKQYPFYRFVDPWGGSISYDYYFNESEWSGLTFDERMQRKRSFPILIAPGPDKTNGTGDDIKSR